MTIEKILEEYLDTFKFYSTAVDIYKNPSKIEIEKTAKYGESRFIATAKPKAVYFFNPGIGHLSMAKKLGIGNNYHNLNNIAIFGVAEKSGRKWLMSWSFGLDPSELDFNDFNVRKFIKKILRINWTWLSSYMVNFPTWWKKTTEEIKQEYKSWEKSQKMDEEFKDAFRITPKRYIEVFENPTKKELEKATEYNTLRFFIVPKGKKVIAFTPIANHNDVARKLGFTRNRFDPDDFRLHLSAIKKKGEDIKPIQCQVNEIMYRKPEGESLKKFMKKAAETNWKFVDKYIPGFTDWWNSRVQSPIRKNIASWK